MWVYLLHLVRQVFSRKSLNDRLRRCLCRLGLFKSLLRSDNLWHFSLLLLGLLTRDIFFRLRSICGINLPVVDLLKEKREFVGAKQSVDFHDDQLVVCSESLVDHFPYRIINRVQLDFLDLESFEISDQEKDQAVIICIVNELYKHGFIVQKIDEEALNEC